MYKLYKEESGTSQFINTFKTEEEVHKYINYWLDLHNYHAHYFRTWFVAGQHYVDFGSWSVLFHYEEVEDE